MILNEECNGEGEKIELYNFSIWEENHFVCFKQHYIFLLYDNMFHSKYLLIYRLIIHIVEKVGIFFYWKFNDLEDIQILRNFIVNLVRENCVN